LLQDRKENTAKRLREARKARFEAANLTRTQFALRTLAVGWRNATLPGPLHVLLRWQDVLSGVRHCINFEGLDTDEPASSALYAVMLRNYVREHTTLNDQITTGQALYEANIKDRVSAFKLRGIPGYFPTPPEVCQQMITLADLKLGQLILEPSAGTGELAVAIRDVLSPIDSNDIHCIEINHELAEFTKIVRHFPHTSCADFLNYQGLTDFDRILMNPPFEWQADIDHVRHAFTLLKSGGRLVSVMSSGAFFSCNRKAEDFRCWFTPRGHAHELPSNAFATSGTCARACIVVLDKPAATQEEAA
jgi:SAM-dependent methyltransferase